VIILRFGCLCPKDKVLRSVKNIAVALGKSVNYVNAVLHRFLRNGCKWKPFAHAPRNSMRRKSEESKQLIISRDVLMSQRALSLDERVQDLQAKHNIQVSRSFLFKLYRDSGIRFRRVDLHNVNKTRKKE